MSADGPAVRSGVVSPAGVEALAGLLGVAAEELLAGGVVPPMWHCAQLPDLWPQHDLGADGHPREGVPTPPGPGLRRMFAGGRAVHHAPLRLGVPATRTSEVIQVREKSGRSGDLTFVTVRHTFEQEGRRAVVDEQDIVYRSTAPAPLADRRPAEPDAPSAGTGCDGVRLEVDPVVLFRFSAATHNAHRIHYDRPYAATEGYPDLVIHGPLQVVLMAEVFRRRKHDMSGHTFAYRLAAPAIGGQTLVAAPAGDGGSVICTGSRSGRVASARLTP